MVPLALNLSIFFSAEASSGVPLEALIPMLERVRGVQ